MSEETVASEFDDEVKEALALRKEGGETLLQRLKKKRRLPFVNEYGSVSRIGTYENCGEQFAIGYVDGMMRKRSKLLQREIEASDFGSMVHLAMENIFDRILAEEFSGVVPKEWLGECYRLAFRESGLKGVDTYEEGAKIVRAYFVRNPEWDWASVYAVEFEFKVKIGRFWLKGYIDRIDIKDSDWWEVVDYKTNRWEYGKDDLETNLQMSAYGIAIRKLFPHVKKVTYRFEMLRLNKAQTTTRTMEQLKDAYAYIQTIMEEIESPEAKFEPNLTPLCGWCDYKDICDEYNRVVDGNPAFAKLVGDSGSDLIAQEWKKAVAVEKIGAKRKRDLEAMLKERLKASDESELAADGKIFYMYARKSTSYPAEVVNLVSERSGKPVDEVREAVTTVDTKTLLAYLEEGLSEMRAADRAMLKAEVEVLAIEEFTNPFLVNKNDPKKKVSKTSKKKVSKKVSKAKVK